MMTKPQANSEQEQADNSSVNDALPRTARPRLRWLWFDYLPRDLARTMSCQERGDIRTRAREYSRPARKVLWFQGSPRSRFAVYKWWRKEQLLQTAIIVIAAIGSYALLYAGLWIGAIVMMIVAVIYLLYRGFALTMRGSFRRALRESGYCLCPRCDYCIHGPGQATIHNQCPECGWRANQTEGNPSDDTPSTVE